MSIALLDIVDSNLQLWRGSSALQSPGYALLAGQQYQFGSDARAAARLQPRNINTRFWWQLNTEALQPALGSARHTADLAHAHLLDIHQRGEAPPELILAVSGSMQRDQLALLLGIIEQCPFNAVSLVNRSVALASLYGGPGRLFHLEIQLHQALVSELSESNGVVELQRSVPLPGCGLLQLQERLVEIIAAAFIRQTRFDPRRKAETEQALYDNLPEALRQLRQQTETNIEVNGYRARINRSEMHVAGQKLFDSAPEAMGVLRADDRVLLDPLAALLPGLETHFSAAELLNPEALPQAIAEHETKLVQRDQALTFVTSLPCLAQSIHPDTPAPVEKPAEIEVPSGPEPTHLLLADVARPLVAEGTEISEGVNVRQSEGRWVLAGDPESAQLNGKTAQQSDTLVRGDRITTADGTEALLIEVLP